MPPLWRWRAFIDFSKALPIDKSVIPGDAGTVGAQTPAPICSPTHVATCGVDPPLPQRYGPTAVPHPPPLPVNVGLEYTLCCKTQQSSCFDLYFEILYVRGQGHHEDGTVSTLWTRGRESDQRRGESIRCSSNEMNGRRGSHVAAGMTFATASRAQPRVRQTVLYNPCPSGHRVGALSRYLKRWHVWVPHTLRGCASHGHHPKSRPTPTLRSDCVFVEFPRSRPRDECLRPLIY